MRRIVASRRWAKTKSRVAAALERASSVLRKQEDTELVLETAIRRCLNSQLMVTAKWQVWTSLGSC